MSTYLLAFVVCDFVHTDNTTTNGVLFRVWSRAGVKKNQRYALDQGVRQTTYFEDYFDIAYPLEKQDMMAIPDFAAGAMENWGLILYRETALLYDPEVNSASNKQYVSVVVSHELAHQWFGNLVTPIWWDDLWLNEGFASYVEYLGVNHTEPTWEMMLQFQLDLHYVFTLDALGTSHPIRVPVNAPSEINAIFDTISYTKGASILRMLNWILTEEVFSKGLSDYLKLHSYDNTDSDDLWAALTYADRDYGGRNVKKIMDTWTLQMGYPLLTFDRMDDHTQVNISQKHFLINPDSPVDDKYGDLGYVWEVEISHTHRSEKEFDDPLRSFLERNTSAVVALAPSIKSNDWYLANVKQYGYYRINYDAENWERLTAQLNDDHEEIPVENRAQLIDDAFNLARSGDLDQVTALALTNYLDEEIEYLAWDATLTVMAYIRDMFSRYQGYGPLEKYMLEKITPLYTRFGWDDPIDDPHLDKYNRINAIYTACFYGLADCRETASMLFHQYMSNSSVNPITPNLKSITYCNGIREGGQDEWEFGLERYQTTDDSSEKTKWLYALACSQEPWILSRYLELAFDNSIVRQQDATYVIRYTADNYIGRALAWDFTRANWDRFSDVGIGGLSNVVRAITDHFNTEFDLEQLIEFGEGKDLGSATRAYEQQVEKTKANIKWMEYNAEETAQWLEEQVELLAKAKQQTQQLFM